MTFAFRREAPSIIALIDERAPDRLEMAAVPMGARATESFEAFYLREMPRVLVLARALGGALAAEDLAQETMLAAYRRWAQICEMDSPVGYVRTICLNKAASRTRRLITERLALQRYAAGRAARVETMDLEHEEFWAAVRRLPRRQAQCAALFYALDLPITEIARTLHCAEGTVKVHLSRARAALLEAVCAQETS